MSAIYIRTGVEEDRQGRGVVFGFSALRKKGETF